jgi:hypothetical protein
MWVKYLLLLSCWAIAPRTRLSALHISRSFVHSLVGSVRSLFKSGGEMAPPPMRAANVYFRAPTHPPARLFIIVNIF